MSIILKRILADMIDFWIICFASSFLVLIVTFGKMNISFLSLITYFSSFYLLLAFKDNLFKNASVGKKLCRIKVILNNKTGRNEFKLINDLKRTLPLMLLPIEVFLIIKSNKRIGDIWANTSVVSID